jgi:hypothetical protein
MSDVFDDIIEREGSPADAARIAAVIKAEPRFAYFGTAAFCGAAKTVHPLAFDVDARASLSIDQFDSCGIASGYSPPCSMVSKRRPVPFMCGSCGRFSGVISANL